MTWTEVTEQSETWTPDTHPNRRHVFDPSVFAPNPVFDTYSAGLWIDATEQSETWTPA